jgi:hypothetical protein
VVVPFIEEINRPSALERPARSACRHDRKLIRGVGIAIEKP